MLTELIAAAVALMTRWSDWIVALPIAKCRQGSTQEGIMQAIWRLRNCARLIHPNIRFGAVIQTIERFRAESERGIG